MNASKLGVATGTLTDRLAAWVYELRYDAWLRRHVARRSFPLDRLARIEETIEKLEMLPRISELTALLRPEEPR